MVAVKIGRDVYDVRVDRKTRWGNPFFMRDESQRAQVVADHKAWLWAEIRAGRVAIEDLAALHNKRLGCHCAPRACHADTLTQAAAWAHNLLAGHGLEQAAQGHDMLALWAQHRLAQDADAS